MVKLGMTMGEMDGVRQPQWQCKEEAQHNHSRKGAMIEA